MQVAPFQVQVVLAWGSEGQALHFTKRLEFSRNVLARPDRPDPWLRYFWPLDIRAVQVHQLSAHSYLQNIEYRYTVCLMIKSYRCKDTQRLANGYSVARFRAFERAALRKLTLLHAAETLGFLRVPPGNKLEALKGSRKGAFSIRINDQWRICFRFKNGNAYDVEIVDYH